MIQRKTVTVIQSLAAANEWNISFPQVDFIPDEVIVKCVSTISVAGASILVHFWTDLINDILFSVGSTAAESSMQALDLHYSLAGARPVQGNFVLRAFTSGMLLFAATPVIVSFQLEFVKYN